LDRLDRGHDLTAGVLHQDQRGNADFLGRSPIGFAHLRGVQYPHADRFTRRITATEGWGTERYYCINRAGASGCVLSGWKAFRRW
jgi:hypothetical protein